MANPDIPRLLREAERRVNEHVWGDRRAIVSIPADVSRDVDILLLTAADEIELLRTAARDLLQYLDEHHWGLVPEGATADRLRDLVGSPAPQEAPQK